ncbi:hypothetical protein DFP74_2492 [Nocardiopsis sp. Huas11]|nr:hypothetical protein [Nocardiopsis sp. Huas11]RKS06843.1 hypothetical protein DFP74_2492 [Nocardiopsis sp. Huas11]
MTATPLGYGLHHVLVCVPANSEGVCRAFYVRDPLGNRLEFLSPEETAA